MSKYLRPFLTLLLIAGVSGCDSTVVEDPLRFVAVQYAVHGVSAYAATEAHTIAFTGPDGVLRFQYDEPLPWTQDFSIQAGSEVTFAATVVAPQSESGVRIAIWSEGNLIGEQEVAGQPGDTIVERTISLTRTLPE